MPKKQKTRKNFSLSERLLGLAELARPVEWTKSLMNMVLAALIAYYVYSASLSLFVFVQGFFSVALLWSGLYAFNDYTDRKIDAIHSVKRNRPIPSGKVPALLGLAFSLILMLIGFGLAVGLGNEMLFVCLAIMLINQVLYTTKPTRLKTRKYFDVISGSMINPFFRYFSGLVLFVPFALISSTITPIFPVIFVVGIQFSGYSLYRLYSKGHDIKLKMKSSVVLLPEKLVKRVSYVIMLLAALSYLFTIINGATLKISWLGFLPPQYFLGIVLVLIFGLLIPDLRRAVTKPQMSNMKTSYRVLYFMNTAFVVANLIIFYFLP